MQNDTHGLQVVITSNFPTRPGIGVVFVEEMILALGAMAFLTVG